MATHYRNTGVQNAFYLYLASGVVKRNVVMLAITLVI